MRLDKLYIATFKNLKDFQVNFDEESPTTVLIGHNGVGKSNLLEALVIIFRDLDLGEPPLFRYELHYVCRDRLINVDADPRRRSEPIQVTVDGERVPYKKFSQQAERQYLPSTVFGYYSGTSNRLEKHFQRHQDRFYDDLLANTEKPLRPLFYARLEHAQFVLLAFFTEHGQNILRFLDQQLRIEGLESILFVMREPPWKSDVGDSRFWNARGVVQGFLNRLYDLALAPVRIKEWSYPGFVALPRIV